MEETPPTPNSSIQEDVNEVPSSSSSSSLVKTNLRQSPMDNSLIVSVLLDFYHPDDLESLKTFALVSSVWRYAARPRWNALLGTLRLYPTEKLLTNENEDNEQILERTMDIKDFCCFASKNGNFLQKYPYQKYELRYWDLWPNHFGIEYVLDDDQILNAHQYWFWVSDRLQFITHLNMHHCKAHGGTFTMYSEEFLQVFPSLKSLKILGANISEEAVTEILDRFSSKSDYYEHPNLQKVHLEPLLPMNTAYRALAVFNRSMTAMKNLYVRELREEDPDQEYKIADFTPGHYHNIHQLVRSRAFDTLDVVEYTSSNPEYRAFRNYPVHSRDGISSFPGTFEVFSGSIQKEIDRNTDEDEEVASCDVMFNLDMYACPFSTHSETHVCWDDRLHKISLWGGFACSLGFLRGLRKLEELTYNTSCFGNAVHRRKVLKFLEEDNEGTFQDKNPFGRGNQLEIKGDMIMKWPRKRHGSMNGACFHVPIVTTSPPRPLNRNRLNRGFRRPWVFEPDDLHFNIIQVNGSVTITSSRPEHSLIAKNLRKLDIDFRFGAASSWKSLGYAFPNVTVLKGVIQGDTQLIMVGKTWPNLRRLMVGHGSTELSLDAIFEVVAGLKYLREFEWKGCTCLGILASPTGNLTRNQRNLAAKQKNLEKHLAVRKIKFTLPWELKQEGEMERICLEKVFDDAMRTGRISKRNLELLLSL